MHFRFLLILITFVELAHGQAHTSFEQTAFNFFRDSILFKEKFKGKLYFKDTLASYHKYIFRWPACLNSYTQDDFVDYNHSGNQKLLITNTRIVEKKNALESKPTCFVLQGCEMKNGHHIISIIIMTRNKDIAYRIEINENYQVVTWCRQDLFMHES